MNCYFLLDQITIWWDVVCWHACHCEFFNVCCLFSPANGMKTHRHEWGHHTHEWWQLTSQTWDKWHHKHETNDIMIMNGNSWHHIHERWHHERWHHKHEW